MRTIKDSGGQYSPLKMKKYLILSGLLLTCAGKQETQRALQWDRFIWSAYSWHLNDTTARFSLYLGQYLEIAPDGSCFIMRHDTFMGPPQLGTIQLSDTVLSRLHAAFAGRAYADAYDAAPAGGLLYCGPAYLLEYVPAGRHTTKRIRYIPPLLPQPLKDIASQLGTIVRQRNFSSFPGAVQEQRFHYAGYRQRLERHLIATEGVPIIPPRTGTIRFAPPGKE